MLTILYYKAKIQKIFAKMSGIDYSRFSQITDKNQQKATDDLYKLKLHNYNIKIEDGNVIGVYFSQNWIKEIPQSISHLKYIKNFNLGMNKLRNLPNFFKDFKFLKTLDLSWNKLEIFPEQLLSLSNLEILDLSLNKLRKIPESISNLKNLKIFKLRSNYNLKSLPESLSLLKNLKVLDLTLCYDIIVPKSIERMPQLKIIGLDDLKIDGSGNLNIQLLIRDYGTPSVNYFADEKMRNNVINAHDLVINNENIFILFRYPLSTEVIFEYENSGGFTRLDPYRCIYEGYKRIYDEEENAVGDPGSYGNVLNRRRSKGPYGIWGHYLSELWIEKISYNLQEKTINLYIGS